MKTLGEKIKFYRKKNKMTQLKLATKIEVKHNSISDWENDKNIPSLANLEKIADALDIYLERLTGESASSIIEDRLDELKMTSEELSEKTKVSKYWIENLDSFIPGEFGGEEIGYEWITRIAKVLKLSPGDLRTALARQEIPAYDGPQSSIEEDFGEIIQKNIIDNKMKIIESMEFHTPEDAMKFILEQPVLMNFGGYDLEKMTDDEIMALAEDLLLTMKIGIERMKKKQK